MVRPVVPPHVTTVAAGFSVGVYVGCTTYCVLIGRSRGELVNMQTQCVQTSAYYCENDAFIIRKLACTMSTVKGISDLTDYRGIIRLRIKTLSTTTTANRQLVSSLLVKYGKQIRQLL